MNDERGVKWWILRFRIGGGVDGELRAGREVLAATRVYLMYLADATQFVIQQQWVGGGNKELMKGCLFVSSQTVFIQCSWEDVLEME